MKQSLPLQPARQRAYRWAIQLGCLLVVLAGAMSHALAQGSGSIIVNLGGLDGSPLTPEGACAFTIQSNMTGSAEVEIKGSIRYRQSGLWASYTSRVRVSPGQNRMDGQRLRPNWSFSGSAFRELFLDYRTLPQGTYEYCVTVTPYTPGGELIASGEAQECLYGKSEDLFLINLVSPDNDAKLYERYPVFSWIVNYPFASQLTYRIRVAEIKEGQNAVGAVVRNNPVYVENNLPQTTITYPVYGKPLETFQPYAWTVDAYYKGVLLGGAEPWKFTILEDSEMAAVPRESSFVDISKEWNNALYYAVGNVKLKYVLDEKPQEALSIRLLNGDGKPVNIGVKTLIVQLGDNRREINLRGGEGLKHLGKYMLEITNSSGKVYQLPMRYVNPDFL